MNRAFDLVAGRRRLAPSVACAAALTWTLLFALHTLGGALAWHEDKAMRERELRATMLIETAPMFCLLLVAAWALGEQLRSRRIVRARVALAWVMLPPIADALIWQPVAGEITTLLAHVP